MEKAKALQNIAKKGNVEVAALQKEFDEIFKELPDSPDRERMALRELNSRYSAPDDKTVKLDVLIFGYGNLTDFNSKVIKNALGAYKKNPEKALSDKVVKLVDGNPIPLDIQKKKKFGDKEVDNKNYGKPLGHSWNKNVWALVSPENEDKWAIKGISLRGDYATTSLPPTLKVLNTNLLQDDKTGGYKSSRSTKFTEIDKTIDFNGLLSQLASDKVVVLGDTFDWAEKHKKDSYKEEKEYYQRFIITSGDVQYMNDPKAAGDNYNGTIDDFTTEEPVTVFVDGDLPKPELGQEYTFIAQPSIKKKKEKQGDEYVETDEEQVILNILGFYA